jgi:hypothetical protein
MGFICIILCARRQSRTKLPRLAARAFKPHNGSDRRYRRPGLGLTEKKLRLTLHTDYALRVLIHVAIADGKLITISDIAESFDISKQHLMKVVNDLSQKGYVKRTTRGISARR